MLDENTAGKQYYREEKLERFEKPDLSEDDFGAG